MERQPPNFRRNEIINNNQLEYISKLNTSDRNKEIDFKYANGMSYKELSKEYNLTQSRIAQIVVNCVRKLYNKDYIKEWDYDNI